MITEQMLRKWAQELGFAEVSFCSTAGFDGAKQVVESQQPLAERRQLRYYPESDWPQAKSLAVLLWPYQPSDDPKDGAVFVDSYYAASNAAYHAARTLEAQLLEAGCFAKANVSYPAKEAAVRAGLGRIGRNSLLITQAYGTRVVIILIATDIAVEACDDALHMSKTHSCLGCGRCAAACPSGAIDAQGMTHPERCLRNFMMEGIVVPVHLRERIGMRLIGCDVCQRVCPMQPTGTCKAYLHYSLDSFVSTDQTQFSAALAMLADEIGRNTARPQRVRAQIALLAGNSMNPAYLPVLRTWAESPFEAVREHARWAIERIESCMPGLDRQTENR